MRTIVYDTEFIENGSTIDLISIGMVDDSGREFYAVDRDAPWKRIAKHEWLSQNVAPHLPRLHGDARMFAPRWNKLTLDFAHPAMRTRRQIADGVRDFVLAEPGSVELWADYGAYDHVVLSQLFGTMMDLPGGVPMFTHELQQAWENAGRPDKPAQTDEHNALADARYGMALWRACTAAT
jgi:hypothetical protein